MDWVALLAVVARFVLSTTGGLIAYVFRTLARDVRDNTRHLQAVATSLWVILYRVDELEQFLERQGFEPPRRDKPPDFMTGPESG